MPLAGFFDMERNETLQDFVSLMNDSLWLSCKLEAEAAMNAVLDLANGTFWETLNVTRQEFIESVLVHFGPKSVYWANVVADEIEGITDRVNFKQAWQMAYDETSKVPNIVEETFYDCNVLKVVISDNGPQGGDAGHGCRVKFSLKDEGGTCMYVNGVESESVDLEFRGDSERATFLSALKLAVQTIEMIEE
jgi:hypothetical protein